MKSQQVQDVTTDAKDVVLQPISEGIIQKEILSHYVAPQTSVDFAENMHNDDIGWMTTRRPFVHRSSFGGHVTTPMSCLLTNNLISSDSALLYWQDGRDLWYQRAISSNSNQQLVNFFSSSTIKNRFDVLDGHVIMTNAGGANTVYFHDGGVNGTSNVTPTVIFTSSSTTGMPGNIDLISAGFSGRIWAADSGSSAARVFYSDVLPLGWDTAPGTFPATSQGKYITLNPNNGDKVTGFARTQNILCVFTNNGIYRIYNTQSVDNTPVSNVGAFQQEAIVKTRIGYFFYHPSGIFKLNNDGTVQELSKKVYDFIKRIPAANQPNVFGWSDNNHVYFYVGTNIPGYQTDKKYYLRYTISTQVTTILSTYNTDPACASTAYMTKLSTTASGSPSGTDANTTETWFPATYLLGTFNGAGGAVTWDVFDFNTENSAIDGDGGSSTQTGQPIFINLRTHWKTMGKESHLYKVNGVAYPHENAAGFLVQYQMDNDPESQWRTLGTLDDNYVTLFREFESDEFNRIRFQITGRTKGQIVRIGQPTLISVQDYGYRRS